MANYTVVAGAIASHDNTLVANTADSVTFTDTALWVEVLTDGTAKVYFTVDGTAPAVSGSHCYLMPTYPSALTVVVPNPGSAVVKLVSTGTPVYSVVKVA